MMIPTLAGWKVETIGDDIAWMKFGKDGRLYAANPEAGFFGVAPGTSAHQPQRDRHARSNTVFTNCAKTDDGDIWWEGLTGEPPDTRSTGAATTGRPGGDDRRTPQRTLHRRVAQCPSVAPEWDDPAGVPIDAMLFGDGGPTVVPLVYEARDWEHGVFLGSTMASEKTAAATGNVGELRFDPMAMLPFCGYHMADYFAHWLRSGTHGRRLPRIFVVNWFRKDEDGKFLWPGFGENSRVLAWIFRRAEGEAEAVETPIGLVPPIGEGGIEIEGLDITEETMAKLLEVDPEAGASSCRRCTSTTRASAIGCRMRWRPAAGARARLASSSVDRPRVGARARTLRGVVLPFIPSDAGLLALQAGVVAAPRAASRMESLRRFSGRGWALVPIASIVVVIFGIRYVSDTATGLTYLALVAVPLLAAAALGWAMRGSAPLAALGAVPLFVLAWVAKDSLAGQAAGAILSALSCVTLGVLLAAMTPPAWLKVGILLMAGADVWLVASDLLQNPNATLTAAAPAAGLPQLQSEAFGSVTMGYGDLFIAALLGAVLAERRRMQVSAALLTFAIAAVFDLLFLLSTSCRRRCRSRWR